MDGIYSFAWIGGSSPTLRFFFFAATFITFFRWLRNLRHHFVVIPFWLNHLGCLNIGVGDEAASAESHKKELSDIRKRAGNMLLLCPSLLHNLNLFNARVLLLVAGSAWLEQTVWSCCKTTPDSDRSHCTHLSSGAGEDLLREMWRKSTHDAVELSRLGWTVIEGMPAEHVRAREGEVSELGVDAEAIPGRLMSFLLNFLEQRLWTYAWHQFSLPESFAATLHPNVLIAQSALERINRLWVASTDAESSAQQFPGAAALRSEVYWLSWPINQWLLRVLAHFHFLQHPTWVSLFRTLYRRIGDSKCIEETHRIGRATEKRGQQPDVMDLTSLFARLTGNGTPLHHRGMRHAIVPDAEAYDHTPGVRLRISPPATNHVLGG